MIRVEGFEKEYTLDLNEIEGNEVELLVVSKDKEGIRHSMWGVDTKSSDNFNVEIVGNNTLCVSANTPYICGEEFFWLVNTNKDKYKVKILPSKKVTQDKVYEFDAQWLRDYNGGSPFDRAIAIKSTVNGEDIEWECSHDGFPLKFDIIPNRGMGNAEAIIFPTCTANNGTEGFFEFVQEESGITIRLHFIMNGKEITIKE